MATTFGTKAFGSIFTSVQNTVKTSSGSAVNIVICLVTVGSEQLFSFAAFNCPCPPPVNNTNTDGSPIVIRENNIYGWVFIVVPAFALFILGYAMNIKTWKWATGCWHRNENASRGGLAVCVTILEIFAQSVVAPMAWLSIAFLDGKYYACAITETPYTNSCEKVLTMNLIAKSSAFEANKRKSQVIGWIMIAATLLLGSLFYLCHRCCSPLTYHHRKYAGWYRELESEAFEVQAKTQIKLEVEKETVKKFLQKKRKKTSWDKISTVFTFRRDDKNFALYSRLDEWNEEHEEPLLGDEEHLEKEDFLTSDDSSLDPPPSDKTKTVPKYQKIDEKKSNEIEMQEVKNITPPCAPKLSPPPKNKNAGKRKDSVSSADASSMTSQESNQIHNVTSQEPIVRSQSRPLIYDNGKEHLINLEDSFEQSKNGEFQAKQKKLTVAVDTNENSPIM